MHTLQSGSMWIPSSESCRTTSLPGGEASFALPYDHSYIDRQTHYEIAVSGFGGTAIQIAALADGETNPFDKIRQAIVSESQVIVAPSKDVTLGRDAFGVYTLIAQTQHDGRRFLMSVNTESAENVATSLAIWRSLGDPVDSMTPLRDIDIPVNNEAIDQATLDSALLTAFEELVQPDNLLAMRQFGAAQTNRFSPSKINLFSGQSRGGGTVIAEILQGTKQQVLDNLAPNDSANTVRIHYGADGCAAMAAQEVDLGQPDQPFTLVLRQNNSRQYGVCLQVAKTLNSYDYSQALSDDVAPGLLDSFGAYKFVSEMPFAPTNGLYRYEKDALWGVINERGKIILPPAYDSINAVESGYRLETDQGSGFADLSGTVIVPPKHARINLLGQAIV